MGMILKRTVNHRTRFGGASIEYEAHSLEKAIELSIPYVYWKDLDAKSHIHKEEVFWVLSDDDVVVPIFHVAPTPTGYILRGPFGQYILPRNRKKARMFVLSKSKAHSKENFTRKHQIRSHLDVNIVTMAANGMDINEIVNVLSPADKSSREDYIKKFYQSEKCAKMIREEVKQILNNVGLTEEKVVEMLLEAHETAKEKRDVSNMLRATENLVELFGLNDKTKETTTRTLEIESEVEDLARLENVRERARLTQKDEKE